MTVYLNLIVIQSKFLTITSKKKKDKYLQLYNNFIINTVHENISTYYK